MHRMQALFAGVRAHGAALLERSDEPVAELLAMVWGPRFDREHARQLAPDAGQDRQAWECALQLAADNFDGLPPPRQQRLRELLWRRASGTIRA